MDGLRLSVPDVYKRQALNATKAAVQEGVVAGGGTAPINAIPAVRALCDTLEGDERTGAKIVLKALEVPLRQIAKNAGLEGSVIIDSTSTMASSTSEPMAIAIPPRLMAVSYTHLYQ